MLAPIFLFLDSFSQLFAWIVVGKCLSCKLWSLILIPKSFRSDSKCYKIKKILLEYFTNQQNRKHIQKSECSCCFVPLKLFGSSILRQFCLLFFYQQHQQATFCDSIPVLLPNYINLNIILQIKHIKKSIINKTII